MIKITIKPIAFAVASSLHLMSAFAAPPSNSPYNTEQQFSYNKDSSAEALSIISVVACYIRNMAPELGFNAVGTQPYLALVDANQCDSDKQASSDTGSAVQSKNYESAVVQSSVNASGVLDAKIWLTGKNDDGSVNRTWVSARVVGGPAKAPPFGEWEVNWCDDYDEVNQTCPSIGHARVDASGSRAYNYNNEQGRQQELAVIGNVSIDQKSGGGKFSRKEQEGNEPASTIQGYYGFEPSLMYSKINDATEQCLIPRSDASGARSSSWETWLYDTSTGQRVDVNSGFSIKDAQGNWGFAGNWGVSVGNRSAREGEIFTRVNSTGASLGSYTAIATKGKLEKIEVQTSSLSNLAGLTLRGNAPKSLVIDGGSRNDWIGIYYKWNAGTAKFEFTAYDECGNNGCATQNLQTPLTFSIDEITASNGLNQDNLWAYQEGTSNNYNIVLAEWKLNSGTWSRVSYDPSQVIVRSRKQTIVSPGDTSVPANLACVGNCVNEALTPSGYGTVLQSDVKRYTWAANTGSLKSGSAEIDFTGRNSSYYSGVLVSETDLQKLSCKNGDDDAYCEGKADTQLTTYYRWQSGPDNWSRFTGLKNSSGEVVKFEQPLTVSYDVPTNDSSSYAGKRVTIQYPGSGNLWIPGYCFDTVTGERAQCNQSTEWANEFSIPFDPQLGVVTQQSSDSNLNGKTYLVKTLRKGVYFPAHPTVGACDGLKPTANNYANKILPTRADWKNPANPASAVFIGQWKEPTGTPLIIDGKLQ